VLKLRLLDTNLIVAIRCPDCGKIKFHSISMFKLPSNARVDLFCDCGSTEMTIIIKDNKAVLVDIPCIACEINHTYTYSLKDILRRKVIIVCCTDTGLELCFMGSEKDVRDVVVRYQEDINTLLGELGEMLEVGDEVLNKFKFMDTTKEFI
jgi:hypothetical protein